MARKLIITENEYIIALCVLPQLAVAVGSWVGAPDDVPVADTDTAVRPTSGIIGESLQQPGEG